MAGHVGTLVYVLLAVVLAFVLVRPLYRIALPKQELPPVGELVGIVAFLLMLAPLSALLISAVSLLILAALWGALSMLAPTQAETVANALNSFPTWLPYAAVFAAAYLVVFVYALHGYKKALAPSDR